MVDTSYISQMYPHELNATHPARLNGYLLRQQLPIALCQFK